MDKKYLITIIVIIVIIGLGITAICLCKKEKPTDNYTTSNNVVLSLEDTIKDDTIWCGTFNLIWNDLKNDLAKQDIVFTPQLEEVINLNKGTFSTKDLNDASYYKAYGHPTLEFKKELEKGIKEKFNETSDILDDFDWNGSMEDYILYTTLKKVFNFNTPFDKLKDSNFKDIENVKYFGINDKSDNDMRNQVTVLYYDETGYAVKLSTKENDEVILVKGDDSSTFLEVYNNILAKESNYDKKTFTKNDSLRIPNLKMNIKKSYDQLTNKLFQFSNGDMYYISKALQTIKFELDNKGGKIKSEAGMQIVKYAAALDDTSRSFNFDDTFIIFLKEEEKDLPYFAAKISDIKQFQ